jgi:hypothetical protein
MLTAPYSNHFKFKCCAHDRIALMQREAVARLNAEGLEAAGLAPPPFPVLREEVSTMSIRL